jgi:hypothetical protein
VLPARNAAAVLRGRQHGAGHSGDGVRDFIGNRFPAAGVGGSTWSSIFRHDGYVSLRTALQAKSAGANTPLADSLATTTAR